MSADEIRRSLEENEAIAVDRDKLSVHAAGHKNEVPPKRPANVLEKEMIIEDDDTVLSLNPGADESSLEAEKGQKDAERRRAVDLMARESKRPWLYNGVRQSEEEKEKEKEEEDDDDDDDDYGDEEVEEEYRFAPDEAGNGSGCLKITTSVIDSSIHSWSKIGAGRYGAVYKAFINEQVVAVKILHSTSANPSKFAKDFREFETEVDILGKITHRNLVRLIGCCKKRRAIVYEYLSNGSLEELIQIHKKTFRWKARVSVACSICEALVFLHSRSEPVVHGDLKPSNILFDSSNVLKLGDFGISRILKLTNRNGTRMHIAAGTPKGTINYIDPEFIQTGQLTTHADTFAFGVIILQLVTGKTANDLIRFVNMALFLCRFVESDLGKLMKTLEEAKLIDRALRRTLSVNDTLDALDLLKLGFKCCTPTGRLRPSLVNEVFPKLKQLNEKLKLK